MRWFRNWWFVTAGCAILLALLLTLGLPLVVGFLRPTWVRILCLLLVAGGWGLLAWLRRRKAKRAADAIAAELNPPSAADEEGRALAQRMRDALGQLRAASGRRRDYLYTRPWYVIIGPPAAGKTTALLNSGLRFPFGEQVVKGVGGTRNLDFWFADEAVMIDTAGRYTTQDSDQQVDAAGWTALLALLRRHRPLQPINGVIVAIGVDELIRSDCAHIDAHARAVRRRLAELRKSLEVAAPVYVLLTKADLLSGFTEYFADLDVEGRRAVAGATLPVATGRPDGGTLARAFDAMAKAIADRQAKRLFDEQDPRRRALLLGFPAQLQSLRARLMRFLDGVFVTASEPSGSLRGFYLSSGTQEGAPLDRIISSLVDVYDLDPEPPRDRSGRAYFLNRLLTEVLFPEAGLVTMDPPARLRLRTRLVGALAGIALVVALSLVAWTVSFANNRAFQSDLLARSSEVSAQLRDRQIDLREVRDGGAADLRAVLPVLDQLRGLPRGYDQRRKDGGPPLGMTFGLYQSGLSAAAEESYRDGLRRMLLPRVMLRLEQYLQANRNDPRLLFEPLKAYLLLGGVRPMEAGSVRAWVTGDWATELLPGADAAAERASLTRHLDALLGDRDLAAAWPDRKPPLDAALIADARRQLGTLDPADRAYALLRQRASDPDRDWILASHLTPGEELAFASPDALLSQRVDYFFTRAGFEKAYLTGRATIEQVFVRDYWVFSETNDVAQARVEARDVQTGIAERYAQDYIAAWDGVVAAMKPVDYFDPANRAAFGAITRDPSPIKKVLLELRKNTIFEGGAAAALNRGVEMQVSRNRLGGYIREMQKGRAEGLDAGGQIAAHFADLNIYVGDEKSRGKLDEFITALRQTVSASIARRSTIGLGAEDATSAQMATANGDLDAAAAQTPDLLRPFTTAAAGRGARAQVDLEAGALSQSYRETIQQDCRQVTVDHYPFDRNGKADASPADMERVFGKDGTLTKFVTRVRPLITNGPIWHWDSNSQVTATLDADTPTEFAKAGEVGDLIDVGLPVKVSLVRLGSGVTAAEISSGSDRASFASTADPPRALQWQLRGLQEAEVVLRSGSGDVRIPAEGPWALFKLIDKAAAKSNDGPAVKVTFGEGPASTVFRIALPGEKDPFTRTFWSFKCPETL